MIEKEIKHNPIQLFYKEPFEDRWFFLDRYPRTLIRWIIRGRQFTGYRRLMYNLTIGMQRLKIPYKLNNYRFLTKNPELPVGLLGMRDILDAWNWPNPLIVGPCLLDHPLDMPDLFKKHKVMMYLVASEWVKRMFEPYFGAKVVVWPIGIDTNMWPDFSRCSKTIDFLIYEKILWDRKNKAPQIIGAIVEQLQRRGLNYNFIRYGSYKEHEFRKLLQAARYMIFLCEHETQGLAYQEALSCNVPVLAWDQGYWLDPKGKKYEKSLVSASSVPYWDAHCGLKFNNISEFSGKLDEFLAKSQNNEFAPREYILGNLTLSKCVEQYVKFMRQTNRVNG